VMLAINYQEHCWTIKRSNVGDVNDELLRALIDYQKIPKARD
jgi:hypothetical protein